MLANTLSVEDEEAVQAELRELEAEAVRRPSICTLILLTVGLYLRGTVGTSVSREAYCTSRRTRRQASCCTGGRRSSRGGSGGKTACRYTSLSIQAQIIYRMYTYNGLIYNTVEKQSHNALRIR